MLRTYVRKNLLEAGVDEAGRGCLAGPVVAAAVILPRRFYHPLLADSKRMKAEDRETVRRAIVQKAVAWGIGVCDNEEIDELNILNATFLAMHRALDGLGRRPEHILVDGNRFRPYGDIPHRCIVRGDAALASVAAASVLAKTYRDDCMRRLHEEYPRYGWDRNKAYATAFHREAVLKFGRTPYHRRSFSVQVQHKLEL